MIDLDPSARIALDGAITHAAASGQLEDLVARLSTLEALDAQVVIFERNRGLAFVVLKCVAGSWHAIVEGVLVQWVPRRHNSSRAAA